MKDASIQIIVPDYNDIIHPYSSFKSDSISQKINNAYTEIKEKPVSDLEIILDFQTRIYDQLNTTFDTHSQSKIKDTIQNINEKDYLQSQLIIKKEPLPLIQMEIPELNENFLNKKQGLSPSFSKRTKALKLNLNDKNGKIHRQSQTLGLQIKLQKNDYYHNQKEQSNLDKIKENESRNQQSLSPNNQKSGSLISNIQSPYQKNYNLMFPKIHNAQNSFDFTVYRKDYSLKDGQIKQKYDKALQDQSFKKKKELKQNQVENNNIDMNNYWNSSRKQVENQNQILQQNEPNYDIEMVYQKQQEEKQRQKKIQKLDQKKKIEQILLSGSQEQNEIQNQIANKHVLLIQQEQSRQAQLKKQESILQNIIQLDQNILQLQNQAKMKYSNQDIKDYNEYCLNKKQQPISKININFDSQLSKKENKKFQTIELRKSDQNMLVLPNIKQIDNSKFSNSIKSNFKQQQSLALKQFSVDINRSDESFAMSTNYKKQKSKDFKKVLNEEVILNIYQQLKNKKSLENLQQNDRNNSYTNESNTSLRRKFQKQLHQDNVRFINLDIQQNQEESLEKRDTSRSNESKVYDYKNIQQSESLKNILNVPTARNEEEKIMEITETPNKQFIKKIKNMQSLKLKQQMQISRKVLGDSFSEDLSTSVRDLYDNSKLKNTSEEFTLQKSHDYVNQIQQQQSFQQTSIKNLQLNILPYPIPQKQRNHVKLRSLNKTVIKYQDQMCQADEEQHSNLKLTGNKFLLQTVDFASNISNYQHSKNQSQSTKNKIDIFQKFKNNLSESFQISDLKNQTDDKFMVSKVKQNNRYQKIIQDNYYRLETKESLDNKYKSKKESQMILSNEQQSNELSLVLQQYKEVEKKDSLQEIDLKKFGILFPVNQQQLLELQKQKGKEFLSMTMNTRQIIYNKDHINSQLSGGVTPRKTITEHFDKIHFQLGYYDDNSVKGQRSWISKKSHNSVIETQQSHILNSGDTNRILNPNIIQIQSIEKDEIKLQHNKKSTAQDNKISSENNQKDKISYIINENSAKVETRRNTIYNQNSDDNISQNNQNNQNIIQQEFEIEKSVFFNQNNQSINQDIKNVSNQKEYFQQIYLEKKKQLPINQFNMELKQINKSIQLNHPILGKVRSPKIENNKKKGFQQQQLSKEQILEEQKQQEIPYEQEQKIVNIPNLTDILIEKNLDYTQTEKFKKKMLPYILPSIMQSHYKFELQKQVEAKPQKIISNIERVQRHASIDRHMDNQSILQVGSPKQETRLTVKEKHSSQKQLEVCTSLKKIELVPSKKADIYQSQKQIERINSKTDNINLNINKNSKFRLSPDIIDSQEGNSPQVLNIIRHQNIESKDIDSIKKKRIDFINLKNVDIKLNNQNSEFQNNQSIQFINSLIEYQQQLSQNAIHINSMNLLNENFETQNTSKTTIVKQNQYVSNKKLRFFSQSYASPKFNTIQTKQTNQNQNISNLYFANNQDPHLQFKNPNQTKNNDSSFLQNESQQYFKNQFQTLNARLKQKKKQNEKQKVQKQGEEKIKEKKDIEKVQLKNERKQQIKTTIKTQTLNQETFMETPNQLVSKAYSESLQSPHQSSFVNPRDSEQKMNFNTINQIQDQNDKLRQTSYSQDKETKEVRVLNSVNDFKIIKNPVKFILEDNSNHTFQKVKDFKHQSDPKLEDFHRQSPNVYNNQQTLNSQSQVFISPKNNPNENINKDLNKILQGSESFQFIQNPNNPNNQDLYKVTSNLNNSKFLQKLQEIPLNVQSVNNLQQKAMQIIKNTAVQNAIQKQEQSEINSNQILRTNLVRQSNVQSLLNYHSIKQIPETNYFQNEDQQNLLLPTFQKAAQQHFQLQNMIKWIQQQNPIIADTFGQISDIGINKYMEQGKLFNTMSRPFDSKYFDANRDQQDSQTFINVISGSNIDEQSMFNKQNENRNDSTFTGVHGSPSHSFQKNSVKKTFSSRSNKMDLHYKKQGEIKKIIQQSKNNTINSQIESNFSNDEEDVMRLTSSFINPKDKKLNSRLSQLQNQSSKNQNEFNLEKGIVKEQQDIAPTSNQYNDEKVNQD